VLEQCFFFAGFRMNEKINHHRGDLLLDFFFCRIFPQFLFSLIINIFLVSTSIAICMIGIVNKFVMHIYEFLLNPGKFFGIG
jgi:hypothetical protein